MDNQQRYLERHKYLEKNSYRFLWYWLSKFRTVMAGIFKCSVRKLDDVPCLKTTVFKEMAYVPLITLLWPFHTSSAFKKNLLQALMDKTKRSWRSWLKTLKILNSLIWVMREYQVLMWEELFSGSKEGGQAILTVAFRRMIKHIWGLQTGREEVKGLRGIYGPIFQEETKAKITLLRKLS